MGVQFPGYPRAARPLFFIFVVVVWLIPFAWDVPALSPGTQYPGNHSQSFARHMRDRSPHHIPNGSSDQTMHCRHDAILLCYHRTECVHTVHNQWKPQSRHSRPLNGFLQQTPQTFSFSMFFSLPLSDNQAVDGQRYIPHRYNQPPGQDYPANHTADNEVQRKQGNPAAHGATT